MVCATWPSVHTDATLPWPWPCTPSCQGWAGCRQEAGPLCSTHHGVREQQGLAARGGQVLWSRAGQCLTSQDPIPPYLREMQGRPGNGSGDQPRVPVTAASISAKVWGEVKPGRVRFGNSIQRWLQQPGRAQHWGPEQRVRVQAWAWSPLEVASRRRTALSRQSLGASTKPWQGRGPPSRAPCPSVRSSPTADSPASALLVGKHPGRSRSVQDVHGSQGS